MPDGIKFSELQSTLTLGNNDLAAVSHDNGDSTYTSVKVPMTQLGQKVVNDIDYTQALNTTSKKPIGAINELKDELMNIYPVLATSPAPIANFTTDLALPLKSCNVEIKPKQAASANPPSPSNPLPISGTDTVIVTQTGANLWDEQTESGSINASNGETKNDNNAIRSTHLCPCSPNAEYCLVKPAGTWLGIFWYDENENFINYYAFQSQANKTQISPTNAKFFKVAIGNSTVPVTTYGNDTSVNYPSTNTTYHAYNQASDTHTIDLGQTVYGGYLDLITGVLTITHKGDILNNFTFTDLGSNRFQATATGMKTGAIRTLNVLAEAFETNIGGGAYDNYTIYNAANQASFIIVDTDYTTYTDLLSNLGNTKVVYPLETPVSIQLTPEEITAKAGVNNVFGDTDGNTTVEYRESVQKYVDDNIAAVQALVL